MELHNPTLRVLRILEYVDAHPEGAAFSRIAEDLAMPKGTISPILKTLAATDYILAENGQYRIGPKAFELGLLLTRESSALAIIRREMRDIADTLHEICQMGVLEGTDVHYLLKEDADNVVSIISEVGKRVPAYVTGIGKALLSGKEDEEVRALHRDCSFRPYTENSISGIEALLADIRQVRQTKVAYENEESRADICCVAVPLEENGAVRAAISVTVPKFRYSPEKRAEITALLLEKKQVIEETCRLQNCSMHF